MWISKKEWADLFDENFTLKKRIETLESIENALFQAEAGAIGRICYMGNDCLLIGYLHYGNLIQQAYFNEEEIKRLKEEVAIYKGKYMDELQKRLELAEMVRKMDGD